MARQLRIEYSGAFYHVASRGNCRCAIFLSDDDRRYFLKCVRAACERFSCVIHVYCLMENHYHLFLETPRGKLSRIMHLINTSYSIYFNKKHGHCGHPFQGRYKAILVQAEEYARELAPYIHLNPVRVGIVDLPENYAWSNYRDYLGIVAPPPWTSTSFVLGLFGATQEEARRKYAEHVRWRLAQKFPSPLEEADSSGILGTPDFLKRFSQGFPAKECSAPDRELPQLRKLKPKPELSAVLAAAEGSLGHTNKYARKSAIFFSHKNAAYTLKELGEFYRISISAISQICRKMEKELRFNGSLVQAVQEIEKRLFG
jgi:putative transposase